MSIVSDDNLEEISLDDEDRNCLEYKLLMVFAQRNLTASQYGELIDRQSRTGTMQIQLQGPTFPHTQGREANGYKGGADPEQVIHIAEKLVKIIHTTPPSPLGKHRCFYRTLSVEPDGGVDGEDKIIQEIVTILQQSGDRLHEQMKREKIKGQIFKELFSYAFFKKVTDCCLQNLDLSGETEVQQQSVKLAYTMDVTTKLTAVDNHPMNRVMGFGVKYLKEHFSPWIETHGGWEKALGLSDEEEVE
uniref:Apoptosis facilitator Bcl-2-like protein 14 isoform X2 n=1 Tax=Geotrypetes seraphini TaxID=260995 RepID=A0A6P8RV64_GEOSA|nr:apoptosis facilitator Bcl-2-like protein 14 isoform X2 [Geotrypetes seraphini]